MTWSKNTNENHDYVVWKVESDDGTFTWDFVSQYEEMYGVVEDLPKYAVTECTRTTYKTKDEAIIAMIRLLEFERVDNVLTRISKKNNNNN